MKTSEEEGHPHIKETELACVTTQKQEVQRTSDIVERLEIKCEDHNRLLLIEQSIGVTIMINQ